MFCKFYDLLCTCKHVTNKRFEQYDLDNDGRISMTEYHLLHLSKYGKPPTTEQWIAFHLADTNNNGYLTKADVEMFEKHKLVI